MAAPRRNHVRGNRPDILYRIQEMKIHDLIQSLKDNEFVNIIVSEETKNKLQICHEDHEADIRNLLDNTLSVTFQIMEDLMKYNSEHKYVKNIHAADGIVDHHDEFNKQADLLITQLGFLRENVHF